MLRNGVKNSKVHQEDAGEDMVNELASKIKNELDSFWKWAVVDEKKYSEQGWSNGDEEWEYPNWDALINLSFKAISVLASGEMQEILVNCLLMIMALDNEDEAILDECESKLSDMGLDYLFEEGIVHIQPEARWQIAELIGRKGNATFTKYLIKLLDDCNKYVQRRALLSLSKLDKEKAQEIAFQKLKDEDDYLRLVSIRILKEFAPRTMLIEAAQILNNDKFWYIQEELKEIDMH